MNHELLILITGIAILPELMLVVFSRILWHKESPIRRANHMLARILLLLAVLNCWMLFWYHARSGKSDSLLPYYFPLDQILVMFIGPAFYFYIRLLFDRSYPLTWRQLLHHTFAAIPAWIYVIYFLTLPAPTRVGIITDHAHRLRWMDDVLDYLFYLQAISYLFICLTKVKKLRKADYQLQADGYTGNIRWLVYFLGMALVGVLGHLPLRALQNCNDLEVLIGTISITTLVVVLFLQSLLNSGLSMQYMFETPPEIVPIPTLKKIQIRNGLKDTQIRDYLQQLHTVMETEKPYLDHHCSQEMIVERTGIPKHHLSQVVNKILKKNFTDFINEYRCKYACILLGSEESRQLTIEAIGALSGFSTRVNFNYAFKKIYGVAPSDYQPNQKQKSEF
jgi:AraC-like DNA-binding protein